MKNIIKYIFLIPVFFSCNKLIFNDDLETQSKHENFNYLWNQANEKYAYFEVKNIDWDSIKTVYEPQVNEEMSDDAFFTLMGNMLSELKDDHTNLVSDFNVSRFGVKYDAQDNFDWRLIEDNYLPRNYYTSGSFKHAFIDNGNIGYIRFAEFTGKVTHDNMNFMLDRYKNTKGLIIDLRENGGGVINDAFTILSHFVDKETLLFYSRAKAGPGHDEFTEIEPTRVSPSGTYYGKKVMVLVDRGTFSAGSFTSLATKAIPNMILMGDTTGGGLGLPNGGQLPNGWTYRFSISQTLNLQKSPEFEQGVPVEIPVNMNWDNKNTDEIIERAILEINK
ncbi:S41 family peptidase [Flammeovirga sp. MY04]|uniref:S41 family peptidase n=1 Tax=Flammeovirga sp. MY04 TaxID=1191459 RepID=UPI0008064241|nr:S41 family peptidase [Flammeovirga sp. MY04]ANQ47758.1 S41 family peptidase [Flammeovirga sp. MY04]